MQRRRRILTGFAGVIASGVLQADPLVTKNPTGVANDQPYFTQDVGNTRLIFTEANKGIAEKAAGVELLLHPVYEQSFGYQMDTRLSVGLMSSYNQIANGFSTQFPWNRQINYIGGAMMPDYFSSSSWLLTLLAHETTHNYQLNAKENVVSRSLFKVLGNGAISTPVFPAILPNLFESSFMLEGNAVLNESRHGLGGRLYSGRFRALARVQAKAGYLTRERLYNNTLLFPYGEHFYTLGSSYQYYLAETYGVDLVNQYFKNRSVYWFWPFVVNDPLNDTLGKNFDATVADWSAALQEEARSMNMAQGQVIAHSQYAQPLNEQNGKVVFLVNSDGTSRPELVVYDKASGAVAAESTGHPMGKVFEKDQKFYSVASDNTSVWRVYQGLYDGSSHILGETQGKVVQGWLQDGKLVYFDTATSFINPQLHVGDAFYDSVDSSVLVKGGDLYYFKQEGRNRTLYRNKAPIYTFESFYGYPVDVDEAGRVYFIANTKLGSSLYRYHAGVTEQVLSADNVIDARLAKNGTVLVTAVAADEYYYSVEDIKPATASPYVIQLLWDKPGSALALKNAATTAAPAAADVADAGTEKTAADAAGVAPVNTAATVTHVGDALPKPLALDQEYGVFNNIRYSGTTITLTTQSEGDDDDKKVHSLYNINVAFADPLTRSSYNLWAKRDEDLSNLVGVGFSNNQTFLLAGLQAYYVADRGDTIENGNIPTRDSGIAAELRLPFLDQGYWTAEVASTYYQDYKIREREPASLQLNASYLEQHGKSWLPNREASFSAYGVKDRGDMTSGGKAHFTFGLPQQIYVELGGKYSGSDAPGFGGLEERGIELSRSENDLDNDPSRFVIPSLKQNVYVQRAGVATIGISKVFDFSKYYFKFPLSLRRESLLLGYRYFDINDEAGAGSVQIGQSVLGLNLDVLILNVMPLTFALEAVHNDDTTLTDRSAVQGRLEVAF